MQEIYIGIKQKSMLIMHEYYTPKFTEIQAKLVINIIFVNYDHFYVNIIMSTGATTQKDNFINFNYFPRYSQSVKTKPQNIVFASFLSIKPPPGKKYLPGGDFCTI